MDALDFFPHKSKDTQDDDDEDDDNDNDIHHHQSLDFHVDVCAFSIHIHPCKLIFFFI